MNINFKSPSMRARAAAIFLGSMAVSLSAWGQKSQQSQQFYSEQIRQGYQHQQDMANDQAAQQPGMTIQEYYERFGTWGALALGSGESGDSIGVALGRSSKEEAEALAITRCGRSSQDCKLIDSFKNQCIAVAGVKDTADGYGQFGFMFDKSTRKAEKNAIKFCEKINNKRQCVAMYSDCSFPDTKPQ